MKKITAALLAALMFAGVAPVTPLRAEAADKPDFRAVWVCSVLNLDYPSKKGLAVEQMMAEADEIINRAYEIGLNAIVLQVRPCGDALYRSDIFPWSDVLTGAQGKGPDWGFDPLAYYVEKAHQKGIQLHAWINPYRVTHTAQKITDVNKLAANNPARLTPSRAVAYKGALYYDPGLPENRKLILDGVKEILNNYDVDGIHLDDYFYPGMDFPDDASYKKYGAGRDKADWRRENVNTLIQEVQKAVRDTKPAARFGVSPFAIWQNAASTPLGSDTSGAEAYKSMYADTRKWVKEGWLDYICPQIYWYIGYNVADYQKLLNWWRDVCKGTGVDLYVGHAAYREADKEANWSGEILRQLKLNAATGGVAGSVFFRAAHLKGDLGRQIQAYYSYRDGAGAVSMTKLAVNQPTKEASTTAAGYTVLGTCDPGKDLYLNGELVSNRTPEGFFSVYVKLKKGANTLKFTQDGQTAVTRVITMKDAAVSAPKTMNAGVENPYPGKNEHVSAGERFTLQCTAPAGAKVTVKFNGQTLEMATTYKAPDDKKIYAATYTCAYTFKPEMAKDLTAVDAPVYTAVYKGKTYTAAGGKITVIKQNAAFFATVTAPAAFVYKAASTDGGSDWELLKGQKDYVTAITNDGKWARLTRGWWIETANITCAEEAYSPASAVGKAAWVYGDTADKLVWPLNAAPPAVYTQYDGKTLTYRVGDAVDTWTATDAFPRLEGYYVEITDTTIALCLKKPRKAAEGDLPFKGFIFVLDAGHGGTDNGATGPLGDMLAEKHLNLINADKLASRLAALGATVVKTRETDVFYTLHERTEISRRAKADAFISIHANSMAETVDSSNTRGLSVWFRDAHSAPLADSLIADLHMANPLTTRRALANQSNFYVCRPSWCPSVIIETSFVCNIEDFSWLVDAKRQDQLADGITAALLRYYQ